MISPEFRLGFQCGVAWSAGRAGHNHFIAACAPALDALNQSANNDAHAAKLVIEELIGAPRAEFLQQVVGEFKASPAPADTRRAALETCAVVLRHVCKELGGVEWSTPAQAEELLRQLIEVHHSLASEALARL